MATSTFINDCWDGSIDKVAEMLSRHPNIVNTVDEDGSTGLHWACIRGNLIMAKLLISNGADYKLKDKLSRTALDLCAVEIWSQLQVWIRDHPTTTSDTKESRQWFSWKRRPIRQIPPQESKRLSGKDPEQSRPSDRQVVDHLSAQVREINAAASIVQLNWQRDLMTGELARVTEERDRALRSLATVSQERDAARRAAVAATTLDSGASAVRQELARVTSINNTLQQQLLDIQREKVAVASERDTAVEKLQMLESSSNPTELEIARMDNAKLLHRLDESIRLNFRLSEQIDHLTVARLPVSAFRRWEPHILAAGTIPAGCGDTRFRVENESPLFLLVQELCQSRGSWRGQMRRPVSGFRLRRVEAVVNSDRRIAAFEDRQDRMNGMKQSGLCDQSVNFVAEHVRILALLRDIYHDVKPGTPADHTRTSYTFHGPRFDALDSVCRNGLMAVREADAGYFGSGCYTTLNIEYAVKYARGDFDLATSRHRVHSPDGLIPIVLLAASICNPYPVTRSVDYAGRRPDGHSDCFGGPLKRGFDCHLACVSASSGFEAIERTQCEYVELVVEQESQLLPLAILWFEPN